MAKENKNKVDKLLGEAKKLSGEKQKKLKEKKVSEAIVEKHKDDAIGKEHANKAKFAEMDANDNRLRAKNLTDVALQRAKETGDQKFIDEVQKRITDIETTELINVTGRDVLTGEFASMQKTNSHEPGVDPSTSLYNFEELQPEEFMMKKPTPKMKNENKEKKLKDEVTLKEKSPLKELDKVKDDKKDLYRKKTHIENTVDMPKFEDVDVKVNTNFEKHSKKDEIKDEDFKDGQQAFHNQVKMREDEIKILEQQLLVEPKDFSDKQIDEKLVKKYKGTPSWKKLFTLEKKRYQEKYNVLNNKLTKLKETPVQDDIDLSEGQYDASIPTQKVGIHGIVVLLILLLVVTMMTHFISGGSLDPTNNWAYIRQEKQPLGLLDSLNYVSLGFSQKSELILLMLAAFAYTGVLLRTKALHALADKLYIKFGSSRIVILGLLLFISILSSVMYSSYLIIALAFVIIPFIIIMGYTIGTALYVLVAGAAVGFMGVTFNTSIIATSVDSWNQGVGINSTIISALDSIIMKWVIFALLFLVAAIIFYRIENRVDTKKCIFEEEHQEYIDRDQMIFGLDTATYMTTRRLLVLISLVLMLIVLKIGVIKWESMGITALTDFSNWMKTNAFMNFIYGHANDIGKWSYRELTTTFIFMTIVTVFISGMKQRVAIQGITKGINTATPLVIFIVLAGSVGAVFNETGIHYTVLNFFLYSGNNEMLLVFSTFVKSMLLFIVMPFEGDVAQVISQITSPVALVTNGSKAYQVIVISSMSLGIGTMLMLSPTSPLLFSITSNVRVTWRRWYEVMFSKVIFITLVGLALLTFFTITIIIK